MSRNGDRDPRPGYPRSFTQTGGDERLDRPAVFEPAFKHFPRAFRRGEPVDSWSPLVQAWRIARRRATEHALEVVHDSPWREFLILRGSWSLRLWFGAAAREPGDVDWVVTPPTLRVSDRTARRLVDDLAGRLGAASTRDGLTFHADRVVVEDIWTYDRVPGRRIVAPFTVADLPEGEVQMDFVFGESLWRPADVIVVPRTDGRDLAFRAASREQSLAWKIMWLRNDTHPQGKDLYDAVLLAESTSISPTLLEHALRLWDGGSPDLARPPRLEEPLIHGVEWEHFQREYPHASGDEREWLDRLHRALAPALAELRRIHGRPAG